MHDFLMRVQLLGQRLRTLFSDRPDKRTLQEILVFYSLGGGILLYSSQKYLFAPLLILAGLYLIYLLRDQ